MVANFLTARWLRPILALLALAGFALLGGCGGGSGAPNNPFAPVPPPPTPVVILPAAATAFSHTPTVLTVEGGVPPYTVFSSNSAILPVAQPVTAGTVVLLPNNVVADTPVQITAQDSIGQTATVTVVVKAAPIFNTLTVTPNSADCGVNAVCSGQTATAAVTVTGPGGAGIANRQVKFDVVTGAYAIQSNDPANPLVASLTVVSDVNGVAQVILQAQAGVPTQPALLRATDITSGNQQTTQFTIVQTINGSAVLSIVPTKVVFTGIDSTQCTTGFRADFSIFGGKPPYQVVPSVSVPSIVTLVNVPVLTQGGSFSAITTGNCTDANGISLIVTDAQGLQTVATLVNQVGANAPPPPTPPSPLVLSPGAQTGVCSGSAQFVFAVTGGSPPYNLAASPVGPIVSAPDRNGLFTVQPPASAAGTKFTVIAVDSGTTTTTPQTTTATITCS